MGMRRGLPLSLLLCLGVAGSVLASSGDRSLNFTSCLQKCAQSQCDAQSPPPLSLSVRLTRWTCSDNCKYWCMHDVTDQAVENGLPVQQYYGKWPFWRFLGMQEPASVAFSLFNLWSHAQGASKIKRLLPDGHPMKGYYFIWAVVSVNAWIWSSVFHTRDLPLTEKLDYFSAALAILYALYYTVIRLFHLYPSPERTRLTSVTPAASSNTTRKLWVALCTVMYIGHVSYLSLLPRFDYTYNMAFNLILGVLHNMFWLLYALPIDIRRFPAVKPSSYRPSFVRKAGVFVALTTAATALELFDFPPWGRVIDAHALWHLSTAPIALYWYDFLVDDALDGGWREYRT